MKRLDFSSPLQFETSTRLASGSLDPVNCFNKLSSEFPVRARDDITVRLALIQVRHSGLSHVQARTITEVDKRNDFFFFSHSVGSYRWRCGFGIRKITTWANFKFQFRDLPLWTSAVGMSGWQCEENETKKHRYTMIRRSFGLQGQRLKHLSHSKHF